MKITTWNVNGIRAAIGKGLFQSFNTISSDIFCLQEIKAKPEQLEENERTYSGYMNVWNPAMKLGYSGVATYSRIQPQEIITGIGVQRFDDEGRIIQMRFNDFILYNVYFPNGQKGQDRLDYKLAFYSQLLMECNCLHKEGKNIIITGDFNTAHDDIDLANPKENSKNSGFLPEERAWIDKYLENGFIDAYRYLYPTKVEYTWWTYRFGARSRNIGWRLDYFLVSSGMINQVKEVKIHSEIIGSDHCPVSIIIEGIN